MDGLEGFILRAKAAAYVGGGAPARPCRVGSHDLALAEGDWSYLDSYFGGTDFLGQEVVWHRGGPVWAMNYYGHILRRDLIDAARAATVIRAALSAMYAEGRFLGGFLYRAGGDLYEDRSEGGVARFTGYETIAVGDDVAYRLEYHGGLIVP